MTDWLARLLGVSHRFAVGYIAVVVTVVLALMVAQLVARGSL